MGDTREKIRELLQQGKKRSEIARELGITSTAVRYHARKLQNESHGWTQKPKPRFLRRWREYNEALVKRGEAILDLDTLREEEEELARMNREKVGRPFRYTESLMQLLFVWKIAFGLNYRTLEGVARKILAAVHPGHAVPDYTTIQERFEKDDSKLRIYYEEARDQEVAIDSTGRSVGERGTYRESRYDTPYRKYVKLNVSVNVETRQVVAFSLSDANEADVQAFPGLVNQSQVAGTVRKAYADRGYDSVENHALLQERNIESGIRPKTHKDPSKLKEEFDETVRRLNETTDPESRRTLLARKARFEAVLECQDNYEAWRDRTGYGRRAHVEGFFSRDARILGDSVGSRRPVTIRQELVRRCCLLNLFAHLVYSTAGKAWRAEPVAAGPTVPAP